MKAIDRLLQRWRIRQAARYIRPGAAVLDIGCADGALFRILGDRIGSGVGIDPDAPEGSPGSSVQLFRGFFPGALPDSRRFDVICLLAVLEHIAAPEQGALAAECARRLNPGGRVVATVPAPAVDRILALLRRLRLIDGMSLEQHYGFEPAELPPRFQSAGFRLARHSRFQLGLNHVFVFECQP